MKLPFAAGTFLVFVFSSRIFADTNHLYDLPEGSFIFQGGVTFVAAYPDTTDVISFLPFKKVETKSQLSGALSLTYLFSPDFGIELSGTLPTNLGQTFLPSYAKKRTDTLDYRQTSLALQYYSSFEHGWQTYLGLGISYQQFDPKISALGKQNNYKRITTDSTLSPFGEIGVNYYFNQHWLVNASISYAPTTIKDKAIYIYGNTEEEDSIRYDFSAMVIRLNMGWRF